MAVPNPYLLVADGKSSQVLALILQTPALASSQDDHGYSLVHAAASYNELDLMRKLVQDHNVDVNIRDEDEETPLFSVETVDAAKVLVEELGADVLARGTEGRTAAQAIEEDGDFANVAAYLRRQEDQLSAGQTEETRGNTNTNTDSSEKSGAAVPLLPTIPDGLQIRFDTMDEAETTAMEVDPEFRARIEELAAREDFNTPEGQAGLRQLVRDAVARQDFGDERNVRAKTGE